jgi:hypothetical protein
MTDREPPASPIVRAHALHNLAVMRHRAGDNERALPLLSEAQALATTPSEAANLANTAGVLLRATQVEYDDVR